MSRGVSGGADSVIIARALAYVRLTERFARLPPTLADNRLNRIRRHSQKDSILKQQPKQLVKGCYHQMREWLHAYRQHCATPLETTSTEDAKTLVNDE
ncbi:hypothetical protein KIN20_011277 [Parelaphostrongylus tenuis]|uniref:Uncharacterized protein n=1 Tax=Parelaphostrongylus tenuis TaxID=148309 RepID=A0AAD5M957_PARTN|nr:hypothetical protein KIN20_011277 [Parelaphostrongylus tenuis]